MTSYTVGKMLGMLALNPALRALCMHTQQSSPADLRRLTLTVAVPSAVRW